MLTTQEGYGRLVESAYIIGGEGTRTLVGVGLTFEVESEIPPLRFRQEEIRRMLGYLGTSEINLRKTMQAECALIGHRYDAIREAQPVCEFCGARR